MTTILHDCRTKRVSVRAGAGSISRQKRLLMQRPLIGVYLHIPEHERVVTESQGLTACDGHVPENDFPGSDIGKLLQVGFVSHFWIEICKYGGTLVVRRMSGVVDMKVFDCDPFRHITGVAEIMLPGI